MIGLLATMASENSFGSTPKSGALIGAIAGSLIAVQLGYKLKKPILNMMCLPIGMVAGMVVGQVVATLTA